MLKIEMVEFIVMNVSNRKAVLFVWLFSVGG
jgi:hypothetical protein